MTAAAVDAKYSRERLAALVAAVEATDEGVYVTDPHGRVLYENAALRRLLTAEPEHRVLEEAIADARHAAAVRVETHRRGVDVTASKVGEPRGTAGIPPGKSSYGSSVTLQVRTATLEYRVRGTAIQGTDVLRAETIAVVWVRRCRPRQLTAEALRNRYGLTAREGRVASLIAARSGSREIAEVLGISPHTARRHAEAVLRKLGVHSRAEVRERLRE